MIGASLPKGLVNPSDNAIACKTHRNADYRFQQHKEKKLRCIINYDFTEKYDKSSEHEGYCNRYQDVDYACTVIPPVFSTKAFDLWRLFHLLKPPTKV